MKKVWGGALVLAVLTSIPLTASAGGNETYISATAYNACEEYGEGYGIQPELLMAIIEAESGGNPRAVNGNCMGLMQVNPNYHSERMQRLDVYDIYDEEGNIFVGTDYLHELFEEYGEVTLVLDLYNGNSKAFYNYDNGIVSDYAQKVLTRSRELEVLHGK